MSDMPERQWPEWYRNEVDLHAAELAAKDAEIARLREAGREMYNALQKDANPLARVFAPFAWKAVDPDANG